MAPIAKNSLCMPSGQTRGMTPIEKNIIVVDASGNTLGFTYPKRAKGLIKKGRARLTGENKICLACPPDVTAAYAASDIKEDFHMSETTLSNAASNASKELTIRDIFDQIVRLQNQLTQNVNGSDMHELSLSVSAICEGLGDGDYIVNVCEAFRAHEASIQKILALYERMYTDLFDDLHSD